MKNVFAFLTIILSVFSCHKDKVEVSNTPADTLIDTFNLTGKILFTWEYAHIYGVKYQELPHGKTALLPGFHNIQAKWSHRGDKIALSDAWSFLILDSVGFDTIFYSSTSPSGFAWSPDDSEIAVTFLGEKKIQLINIQTHALNYLPLPNNYKIWGGVDWSGANNLLVFIAKTNEVNNPYGLFTIHSDGANTTALATFSDLDKVKNPRFSPGGTTIAFESSDLSTHSIFLIESTGQFLRKYWDWAATPCWSADGTHLMANVTHPNAGKYGEDVVNIEIRDVVGNYGARGVRVDAQYPYLIDWWP